MRMNEVISIKYGWNTIAWTKIMHPGYYQLLVTTSSYIESYNEIVDESEILTFFGKLNFFYLKRQGYVDITREAVSHFFFDTTFHFFLLLIKSKKVFLKVISKI